MVKQFYVDSDEDSASDDAPVFDSDDEEIDEDAAFTAEDYLKYGDVGSKRKRDEPDDFLDAEEGEVTSIADLLQESDDEDEENPEQHKKLLNSIAASHPDGPSRKKFKKLQSEMYEESEYNLRPSAARVEMEDLLPSLEDGKSYGELKKKLEKLSDKKNALEKPLSEPVKDRISRKAAYEKAKKDITRWHSTVQQNRVADQLQFPMNIPKVPFASNKTMTKDFKPTTELEESISQVLEQGGINEKKIAEFEELAENTLTVEEVEQRRAELAKMRSLMFYQEKKSKHQNKIKSRKYHKMLKRAKEKEKLSLEEMAVVDPEKYQKLLEERELARIKERLTLKHSNTSKWAKRAIKQKDLSTRREVHEQVQKGRELRRKMQNMHDSDSETDSDEDMDSEEEQDNPPETEEEKGLHNLKFMKRAAEKQHAAFLESLQEPVDDDDEIIGRRKFGPSTLEMKRQAAEEKQARLDAAKKQRKSKVSPLANFKVPEESKSEGKGKNNSTAASSEHNAAQDAKNPWMNLKGGTKIKKQAAALETAQIQSSGNTEVVQTEINVNDVISVADEKLEANNLLSNQRDIVEEAFVGLDVYKEFEEEKEAILNEGDDDALPTQELPGWGSWAGEGVKMTRRQKHRLRKKKLQKEKELKERQAKRKDAKLNNVIINEEVLEDPKFEKYQVATIPYEFGSKRQYERTLATPLGPEWNTLSVHSTITKPNIVIRPGLNIDPLEAPNVKTKKGSKAPIRRGKRPKNL